MCLLVRDLLKRSIFKVQKLAQKRGKNFEKSVIFSTRRPVFARTITSGVLYLSENVVVTVQNRPVFSITRLYGASKKLALTANISKTVRVTAKVSIEC